MSSGRVKKTLQDKKPKKKEITEKELEKKAYETLKAKLIDSQPINLNHLEAYSNLKEFSRENTLDFKTIEKGFCRAAAFLQVFDYWLISELEAKKEFSLQTLEKLDMLRECSKLVMNTPYTDNSKLTQKEISAYLMIFSCLSELQTLHKRKEFIGGKAHKSLQNIFHVETFLAQPTTLFFYSFESFKKYAASLFTSKIMELDFCTYETDEAKKIEINYDKGHCITIRKTEDGFDCCDTNQTIIRHLNTTDDLIEFIKSSIFKIEVSGNFFAVLWKLGETPPTTEVQLRAIMNTEDYSLDELSNMLMIACKVGDLTMAKLCLEKKADPFFKQGFRDTTPLHIASFNQDEKLIQLLMPYYKKNIDVVDALSETPLYWAAEQQNVEICKLLIENGASILKSIAVAFFKEKSVNAANTLLCSSLSSRHLDELKEYMGTLEKLASNQELWKNSRMVIYKNLVKTAVRSSDAKLVKELFDRLPVSLKKSEDENKLKKYGAKIIALEDLDKSLLSVLKIPKEDKSAEQTALRFGK